MNLPRTIKNGKHRLLDDAFAYANRGLCIIPTIGKRSACRWKRFQAVRPNESELRELFRQPDVTGLAVVLGSVSGGLACRDFDSLPSYGEWADKHPWHARMLPTVKTARGRHVYFRGPDGFMNHSDGEYRANVGHYCLLPPSRHPTGIIYEWVIPLGGELPSVDPHKFGLCTVTQRTQEMSSVCSESCVSSVLPNFNENLRDLENAILTTQPQMIGQRHRKIFELCRRLKAIPAFSNAELPSLRGIVVEWHRRALPVIGTKSFTETWADFVSGWAKVRHAAGEGAIDEIFKRAVPQKPPKKAAMLYEETPPLQLVSLCRELQRIAGDADFFLDCRTAGRLLGVSHKTAWRLLMVLCADGILTLRESGSLAIHKANSYRYIAG
jgi:hypothetical protein